MSSTIEYLLSKLHIHPVLLDIGASGAPPKIWNKIARYSIYVGFDPDWRETPQVSKGHFYKALIINEAVTDDKETQTVSFYLTKSPYCSSTLKPADIPLSDFLFSELFTVEQEVTVRATSLERVLESMSLPGFDWFKTDSQGTDLRLFKSLPSQHRNKVLAIDVEPGLIDAYMNEDLFVDTHRYLTQQGFWLSRLEVQGTIRMKRSTLNRIMASAHEIDEQLIEAVVRKTPAWCEARYLRTLNWLSQFNCGKREYVLLWIFAFLDEQIGFCLDLVVEYERLFGRDDLAQAMWNDAISRLRNSRYLAKAKSLSRIGRKGARWFTRWMHLR